MTVPTSFDSAHRRMKFGWRSLSLSSQFFLAAGIVLCVVMAVLGTWVNEQIKHSVLVTSASQGASFMTGFLEPRVQGLASNAGLPDGMHKELDSLFIGTALGNMVVSIKIWRADGTVLYSTTKDLIGKQFVSTDVARAASGEVVAEYEDLISQESAYEQTLDMSIIEVYAPLYKTGTREVLAVGEIYENADALADELRTSRIRTWIVVCLTTLFMLAVLSAIVRRGAATIARQRTKLGEHVEEAQKLARQNGQLRVVADKARRDASQANEQLLSGIGSDLHDGPIQLLSLALLKLSRRRRPEAPLSEASAESEKTVVTTLTRDALTELRNISSGLSLPEIKSSTLQQALELAIYRHKDMTGTIVEFEFADLPDVVTEATKICAYRVVQEALNNSYKHARSAETRVSAHADDATIFLTISDSGPGLTPTPEKASGAPKLGLIGIQNRVGALKGSVDIRSAPNQGTSVTVSIPIERDSSI